jgi:diguanylate cyclase (GGDEF)-like protein
VTDSRAPKGTPDHELDTLVRHVIMADWLVLGIVVLYASAAARHNPAVWFATAAFAASGVLLRLPLVTRLVTARRIELQSWVMVAFLGFVVWHTGADASPLQGLYLLPVVLAGLVLPATRLAPLVVAVGLACVSTVLVDPDLPVGSGAFAGRAVLAVAPLAIVAWLTHELGAALSSARRRAAALAAGDALTGLTGRRAFIELLQEEVTMAGRRGQPTALLVLDLAGTRRINELYGQDAGNAALKLIADVLRRVLRQTDRAARIGGDEFAVLLSGADAASAELAAKRIRHALTSTTLDVGARHLRCAVSIGIASVPRDGRDGTALLAGAERRLEQDRGVRAAAIGTAAST